MTPLNAQWSLAYNFPEGGGVENLYFADTSHGWFVGSFTQNSTYYRILHTTDGGFTFSPQATPAGTYNLYTVFFEDNLTGWAAGGPVNNGPGAILKTTDGGNSWNLIVPPGPQPSGWSVIFKTGNTVIIGGQSSQTDVIIIKSTNGGTSWQMQQYSGIGTCADMYVFDAQNYVIGGMNGNLRRTTNGGISWISTNLNSNYTVNDIEFVDQNLGYALVSDWNIFPPDMYFYKTSDGGFTWYVQYSWIQQGWKSELSIIKQVGTIFVGGYIDNNGNGGALKSHDGGLTWNIELQTQYPIESIQTPSSQNAWLTARYVYRNDYVPPVQVTRSITLNQGWNLISMPVDAEVKQATMVFPNMEGNMYGYNGSYYAANIMDLGHGYWLKNSVTETINVTGGEIDIQPITFSTAGWHLIGSISTDLSRASLHTEPPNAIVGAVYGYQSGYSAVDTLCPGEGYWVKFSQPCTLFLDRFFTGELVPIDPELIQQQLAELPLAPGMVTEVQPEPIPIEFALEQNFPNPFNPVTTIGYRVPESGEVTLTVYNLIGQEIATLVSEYQVPGSYTATFNAATLPSGTYFYRLTVNRFSQTKKMVLLK